MVVPLDSPLNVSRDDDPHQTPPEWCSTHPGQETLVETDGKFNPSRGTVPTVAELHVQQPGSMSVAFGCFFCCFCTFLQCKIFMDSLRKKRVIQNNIQVKNWGYYDAFAGCVFGIREWGTLKKTNIVMELPPLKRCFFPSWKDMKLLDLQCNMILMFHAMRWMEIFCPGLIQRTLKDLKGPPQKSIVASSWSAIL